MTAPTPAPSPTPANRAPIARAVLSAVFVLLCVLVLGAYALAQWLGTWAWWLIPGILVTAAVWWVRRRWRRRRDRKLGITSGTRRQRAAARVAARHAAKIAKASGRTNARRRAASGTNGRGGASRTRDAGKRAATAAAARRPNATPRTGSTARAGGVRGTGSRRAAASGHRAGRTSGSRAGAHLPGRRPHGYRTPRTGFARMIALKKRHRKRIRKELAALAVLSRKQFVTAWEARQLGDSLSALTMLINWHAIGLGSRAAIGALGAGAGLTWTSLLRARARAEKWARARANAALGPWRALLYTLAANRAARPAWYPPPWGWAYAPDPPGRTDPGVIDGVVVDTTTDPDTPLTGNILFRPRASLAPVPMGDDMSMQPEFEAVKNATDSIVFGDGLSLLTLDAKFRSLGPVLLAVGEMMGRLSTLTVEDMPPNKPEFASLGDRLNTMAGALMGIAQEAGELSPDLRAAFREEIEAYDSGHHNADALDVARNRDGE